jgi:hypothetical protein
MSWLSHPRMNASHILYTPLEHKREGSMKQMRLNRERKIRKEEVGGGSKAYFQ